MITPIYKIEDKLQLEIIQNYYEQQGEFGGLTAKVEERIRKEQYPFYISHAPALTYGQYLIDEIENPGLNDIKEFPFTEAIAYLKSLSAVKKAKAGLTYAEEELEISTILVKRALRLANNEEE